MYSFPWYLTLVSTNRASSNPGLADFHASIEKIRYFKTGGRTRILATIKGL